MRWQRARVAATGTHHTVDGEPLYAERFDVVLAFHAPGLAPVLRGGAAWHIDGAGDPAYVRRFARTFGYYEDLAAVEDVDGWHHVRPDGSDAYAARFAWCGNFQSGRCAVRAHDGRYLHLRTDGGPAYAERWSYVGDYREGSAVVQRGDGLSTHVDPAGVVVHDRWFRDLDVFHKGLARARDDAGWTHIGANGAPAYTRRFAMVEPFYNGQARVEREDGGLEIIDESGRTLRELRASQVDDLHALSASLVGYWSTKTIATAVRLGVIEALPATLADLGALAVRTDRVARLLRALDELGVVERVGARWQLTARGALLRRDHARTLATAALEYDGPLSDAWRGLDDALRGAPPGENVFRRVAAAADRREPHHQMLESYAQHDYAPLVATLPIRPHDVVLDAGGGSGVLAELIAEAFPSAEVVVLDLPDVAALAERRHRVRALGVDLFEPWPVGADVVVFARVLHDWDDDAAVALLRRARAALRPAGRVVILDAVLDPDHPRGALCDLHVLAVTGGRDRTLAEFRSVLERAGFVLGSFSSGSRAVRVMEAVPT